MEAYWPAGDFLRDSERLIPEIEQSYVDAHPGNSKPSPGDVTSWRQSVYWLASLLDRLDLDQVWMFVEYRVDPAMDPIDVVLAGRHPEGGLSFGVIELKQWSHIDHPQPDIVAGLCAACRRAGPGTLCQSCSVGKVFVPAYRKHKKHPAVQVHDNMTALKTHHNMFDDRYVTLVGATYLHNLKDPESQWIRNVSPHPGIDTFTARSPAGLETFLKENFTKESGADAAEALLSRRRSTALLEPEIGSILNGYTQFSLVENQLTAVNSVLERVRNPRTPGAKKVFVISGRAGSGKSLVGLTLLGEALNAGYDASYVSGGVASRETFKRASNGRGKAFATLNSIADHRTADELDLILCDEAHRMTERPMRGSYSMRPGESSVSVVVDRAKVPVFFIDGDQRLFADEVWSPEELTREIQRLGAEVVPIRLERVLRAVGSSTYDTWVRHLLAGDQLPWKAAGHHDPEPFELYYADSAAVMESFLRGKEDAGERARMSAGICWKWEDQTGTEPEVTPEPGWARPWNAGDYHHTPGAPKRKYWATESGGFGQIGCVHTAQGLEYEWGGVILGPDLTWNGAGWAVHREHVLNKANKIRSDDELARAIRNAYGVLLSRSIRGTVLYSVDPATRTLFSELDVPRL
ncbi:DNA/RNA helicase domain-containing protein [Amycolatopsis acidicola]|uniref:DNA/RNA helicase domain-containing protein n=1 Tax=Amycolatopsis acidicola TaxID=2596893 RepID=UPI001AA031CF|nr:DNA/RNA helicase domain-containing protein [Amycolatopsis acidicola]